MNIAIWWIRRDLRLNDNAALNAAVRSADSVIPLFILDPALINSPNNSIKRMTFLWAGLRELDTDLRHQHSRLIIRSGSPIQVLEDLLQELSVTRIFAESDFSPYARVRDQQIAARLPLKLVGSSSYNHPDSVLKADGSPYTVFTPFMRAWKTVHEPIAASHLAKPEKISTPEHIASEPHPTAPSIPDSLAFEPGETAAHNLLKSFTDGENPKIFQYETDRNRLDRNGTSRISPYLRFGMLSTRQAISSAYRMIQSAPDDMTSKGAETWLNELIWREFYISILYHFPKVLQQSFRKELRNIAWVNDEQDFIDWCEGRTGYPVVDAAMRQLLHTGWMHNRARMISASFLVKDLLIDWCKGEKWFMQHLIDGNPASNNGGWQWTAGTGTDAAPYFRIFNPTLQSKKFDPQGVFIRKWVPELTNVPLKYIHNPWKMPEEIQLQIGCIIGRDYPSPIIDHKFARERILAVYKAAKEAQLDPHT